MLARMLPNLFIKQAIIEDNLKQRTNKTAYNTQYKKIGQKVINMNELAINKHSSKLKDWCFKMPNFSYCHR